MAEHVFCQKQGIFANLHSCTLKQSLVTSGVARGIRGASAPGRQGWGGAKMSKTF